MAGKEKTIAILVLTALISVLLNKASKYNLSWDNTMTSLLLSRDSYSLSSNWSETLWQSVVALSKNAHAISATAPIKQWYWYAQFGIVLKQWLKEDLRRIKQKSPRRLPWPQSKLEQQKLYLPHSSYMQRDVAIQTVKLQVLIWFIPINHENWTGYYIWIWAISSSEEHREW